MEFFVLKDLLIILIIAIAILLVGHRLHLPPIVGFLLTGILAGPHGFALIGKTGDVEMLAEIGIILLLFGIGMEFSIKKLIKIKRLFLYGGALQVGVTILLTFIVVLVSGLLWRQALFLGCLLCMSSTAIVMSILDEKSESATPYGKVSIAILIFQDMVAIPMILLLPLLQADDSTSSSTVGLLLPLLKGVVIVAFVFISAQRFVPRLLLLVARTKNKELFLLTMIALCFGVAWFTASLGLSLSIGAFLAGLVISESEYSNEAITNIFPFQALFISVFFISIGMLVDMHFVWQHKFVIIGLAAVVLAIKVLGGMLTTGLLNLPLRTMILISFALCQIGEFSFVLAKTGVNYSLWSGFEYQLFLAVALLTMGFSPLLINIAPAFSTWLTDLTFIKKYSTQRATKSSTLTDSKAVLEKHVIIVGFGVSGRNLARSCKHAGIPYIILEINPDIVKQQKIQGEPIQFGDATNLAILEHAHLAQAKALAVLVNDTWAAGRIVKIARRNNPALYIIARARYMHDITAMSTLGADEAIPDEFGTSIEIFSRVLRQYHIPNEDILNLISDIRADGYELLRNQKPISTKLSEIKLNLEHISISSFRIHSNSTLAGKMLCQSELRSHHGLTVLLIKRGQQIISNLAPETILMPEDILIVIGETINTKQTADIFGNMEQLIPVT